MGRRQASALTTRGSRDLAKWIAMAGEAVKKAREVAPKTRFSRDLSK
jgi:hypothetical protein